MSQENDPNLSPQPLEPAPTGGTPTPIPEPTPTPSPEPSPEPAATPEPLTSEALKLPEGFEVSNEMQDKFLALMNDQDKTAAERAQGLVDLQAEFLTSHAEAQTKVWSDLQDKWQGEVKADAEIGGAKLQDTLAAVGKLVNEYGSDELREALDVTGAGNHPAVVKFFAKIAAKLTEGSAVPGSPAAAAPSVANLLYPSMKGS